VERNAEGRRLNDLLEIGRTLAGPNLRNAVTRTLELLQSHHEILSGVVCLAQGDELQPVASAGLNSQAVSRVRYKKGEGITGRVLESGRSVVVPQVTKEPLYLDLTRPTRKEGRREMSFICVPIPLDRNIAGTLGVNLRYRRDRGYERDTRFFEIVATMVAQAVRSQRLVEAERVRLLEENTQLREELRERYDMRNLIGGSRAMQQVYEQVARVAPSSTTVLVRGESGTGKELVAHAIHYGSPRTEKPFVKVSCGALPEGLIESELFGYEQGAFTDARTRKKGRFELAHTGTLFLDEVGELSPSTQVKLLRVLQEREFERLGGVKPVRVDVRMIAATNKDLEAAVAAGSFREDLYYRLAVFTLYLPSLAERKPDIPLLADHFVEKYAAAHGRDVRRIATTAIDMLVSYHWPGNVRELENCIERAVLVSTGGVIHGHDLTATLQTAQGSGTLPAASLDDAVGEYEKDLILDALKTARGNQTEAARILRSTPRIIGYKLKQHGIDPAHYRGS
jgi:Nif-specific regulatory protein